MTSRVRFLCHARRCAREIGPTDFMCLRCRSKVAAATIAAVEAHLPLKRGQEVPAAYSKAARAAIAQAWRHG